ncbi:MAG: type IX secretion system membrane protein PorP/SprF, partial [Flavobacteriales bacterium]|nr:type IX secretion system membrane protein PorP/SprF [Flavobacteriales bacterium]
MKKSLVCILTIGGLFLGLGSVEAQDIHFSQFYFSPMTMNPGNTGFFNGKHRIASNYKSQWKLASGGAPYVTYSGSYDVHVLDKMMKAADMTGFGVMVFSDKAGTGNLQTSGAAASMAYHRDVLGNGKQLLSM